MKVTQEQKISAASLGIAGSILILVDALMEEGLNRETAFDKAQIIIAHALHDIINAIK